MRIAVIWTFCSWKTTFVENYWLKIKKLMNIERTTKGQENIFNEELKLELENKDFITDNSLITILAYTKELDPENYEKQFIKTKEYLEVYKYDKVIFLEKLDIVDDWFRFTNKELQIKIENNILNICKELNIKYTKWLRFNLNPRKCKVKDLIKNDLK